MNLTLIEKSRIWDRQTPADGFLFENEFLGIFGNFENFYNYILSDFGFKKGFVQGRLRNTQESASIITAVQNNIYEVDGNLIRLSADLNLDFGSLTNIFRADGVTAITSGSETHNKFIYVLLTEAGSLQAMIVPDAEMEGNNHNYNNNPMLITD